MVSKVNWNVDLNQINPFTGQAITASEFAMIDVNGDNVLSPEEWLAVQSSYISQDGEGDVALGDNNSDFLNSLGFGTEISASASDLNDFEAQMRLIVDAYKEYYYDTHRNMSTDEKNFINNMIAQVSKRFILDFKTTNKNVKGPFDMKTAALGFENLLNNTITQWNAGNALNQQKINGFIDNKDAAYINLLEETLKASENENISETEFNKMKASAVKYLMGMLLSGEIDETFVNSYNVSKTNYIKAKSLIQKLSSETDPEKIKQYLIDAEKALNDFISAGNGDKLASAVNDTKLTKVENACSEILTKWADSYYEKSITSDMTDEQKAYMKQFITTCQNKFISQLVESGEIENITDAALQKRFEDYIQQEISELINVQTQVAQSASQIIDNYNSLVSIANSASANGYVSEDEKNSIVDAAAKMILSQIMTGSDDIVYLEKLDPAYKSTKEWSELQSIVASLNSSVDPDELTDLLPKAEELIKTLLNKYTGDQLVTAVNYIKPVEISDSTKQKAIYGSGIYADYTAGASRTTDYGKQNEDRLKAIQDLAKQDLEAYAKSLKE